MPGTKINNFICFQIQQIVLVGAIKETSEIGLEGNGENGGGGGAGVGYNMDLVHLVTVSGANFRDFQCSHKTRKDF